VAYRDAVLVHWHRKVGEWLAPGGHIEPNEDPVQAALREVKEETGLDVRVMRTSPPPDISNLGQVAPPYTVMVEDVFDEKVGKHQHIDFIYFTTPLPGSVNGSGYPEVPEGWHWVTRRELETAAPLRAPNGQDRPPPEDVLKLGMTAIELLKNATA
jgi:8-oxo-dGTP pyrophosphatase MutT (NUDIX family)